jgi:hypothetical protein
LAASLPIKGAGGIESPRQVAYFVPPSVLHLSCTLEATDTFYIEKHLDFARANSADFLPDVASSFARYLTNGKVLAADTEGLEAGDYSQT